MKVLPNKGRIIKREATDMLANAAGRPETQLYHSPNKGTMSILAWSFRLKSCLAPCNTKAKQAIKRSTSHSLQRERNYNSTAQDKGAAPLSPATDSTQRWIVLCQKPRYGVGMVVLQSSLWTKHWCPVNASCLLLILNATWPL